MFLLAQVFTILHQPELIRILTEAILIGDLTLVLSSTPTSNHVPPSNQELDAPSTKMEESEESEEMPEASFDVLSYLRAAHHGKRAVRLSPPGARLQAYLQTLAACGATMDRGWPLSSSLSDDITRSSECIRAFMEKSRLSGGMMQDGCQVSVSSESLSSTHSTSGKLHKNRVLRFGVIPYVFFFTFQS